MKHDVELMNLFWTTAGIFPGEGEISPYDFKDRVEAAAKAGFKGIGIWHTNLLKDARTLVETVGAQNGGLILDIVQIEHLGIPLEEVSQIPLQYLINIELNDGALPGSPSYDPSRARRFCGEGDFNIRGLIRCAQKMGYAGPWAVEVMSPELTKIPLQELAARAFDTTMMEFGDE